MAEAAGHWIISSRSMNIIPKSLYPTETKTLQLLCQPSRIKASIKRDEFPLISKKYQQRMPRHLIKISTAEGRWQGNWNTEYTFSLRDLQLQDLAEDGNGETKVFISLCVDKHAGFGLSVDGRISTCFTRKCCNCSLPYRRELINKLMCCPGLYGNNLFSLSLRVEIDTNFNVWVLPLSRDNSSSHIPEIGGDDPSLSLRALSLHTQTHTCMTFLLTHDTSELQKGLTFRILQVIYVNPGCEADLDSLVQDTIRLTTSVEETCSELCKKAEPKLHINKQNSASIDKRWSRLLELRKAYS